MKSILFLAASMAISQAAPDGKQLFTTNCSACHLLDQMVVGPSLVEIRKLYDGKPDDFVKWSIAPERKRDGAIEMPSMVHVGEDGLREIYTHVMGISKGVKIKVQKGGDPYGSSPTHTGRPQVQRIFMPDAGPAAIAVALDGDTSVCWDAGTSRFRYAWTGGFIDGYPYWKRNGDGLAKIEGEIRYLENSSPFEPLGERKFLGYKMEAGLPVFRYTVAGLEITEKPSAKQGGDGFTRAFTVTPAPAKRLILDFSSTQDVQYTSDKGSWSKNILTLDPKDASEFTVTFSLK